MGIKKELEESYDYDMVDEFLDHFEYICDILESIVISLDHQETYTQNINELFRIFHNLKSASGFLKLKAINNLASFTEDVLERARAKEGPASTEFIDWLLAISDQLCLWLSEIKMDSDKYSGINGKIADIPMSLEEI